MNIDFQSGSTFRSHCGYWEFTTEDNGPWFTIKIYNSGLFYAVYFDSVTQSSCIFGQQQNLRRGTINQVFDHLHDCSE